MSINSAIALALEAVTFGAGNSSCGEWIEARRQRGVLAVALEAWVSGYFTGISSAQGTDPTAGARMTDIYLTLDDQCRRAPTMRLDTVLALFVVQRSAR